MWKLPIVIFCFIFNMAVWSSGGALPATGYAGSGGGDKSSALFFGGYDSGGTKDNVTYGYNGTAWSTLNDMTDNRVELGGAGDDSAALAIAGHTATKEDTSIEYNGTNWLAGGSLAEVRAFNPGCGTQTAALVSGGLDSVNAKMPDAESYNGTSWTTENSMSAGVSSSAMLGTFAAGMSLGGDDSGGDTEATEEYTDPNWSSGGDLTQARSHLAAGGSQTDGVSIGGIVTSTRQVTTELYNGTAWSASADLNAAIGNNSGEGDSGSDSIWTAGGYNSGAKDTTEELYKPGIMTKSLQYAIDGGSPKITKSLTYTIGGSIVLTDVVHRVFQQNASNQASFTVSGTYSEYTANAIEYRIMDADYGTEVQTWATLDATPSGGTFSGTATAPQGGMYTMEVRDSVITQITDEGTNEWGVGDGFVFIGQSLNNYKFTRIDNPATPDSRTMVYDSGGWRDPVANGEIGFLNWMVNDLDYPVFAINAAVNGSALLAIADNGTDGYWLDFATAGEPYQRMKGFTDAVGGVLKGVHIDQGQRDAGVSGVTYDNYYPGLQSLATQLRVDISPVSGTLPIVVTPLGRNELSEWTDDRANDVRDAHIAWAANDANVYEGSHIMDRDYLDGMHPTAASNTVIGQRDAQAFLHNIYSSETYSLGPTITQMSKVDANNLDVTLSHNAAGSDFTPTSGGTGFVIKDDGTPLTITAVARQSGTVVRITVTENMAGEITGSYLSGQEPTSTDILKDDTVMNLPVQYNKDITYVANNISKTLKYCVLTTPSATQKSLTYRILTQPKITKSLQYSLDASTPVKITKSLQYSVFSWSDDSEESDTWVDDAYD